MTRLAGSADQACRVAGIGSGQLTRSLAARGLHVTAVEPGKNLIALARQNLEDAGEVDVVARHRGQLIAAPADSDDQRCDKFRSKQALRTTQDLPTMKT
jgi:tRNA A58 N-methylase Trm61